MKIHFVTYSDEKFEHNREVLCRDVSKTNIFEIHSHTRDSLPVDYLEEFSDFLKPGVRGAGYWTWKPRLILETLRLANHDDVIVWCDAGCSFNPLGIKRLHEWLDMCNEHGSLGFQMQHLERCWTKRSLARHLCCDNLKTMESGQLMATIFLLKKSIKSIEMVEEWYQVSRLRWSVDDSPSTIPNYPDFKEHRHDQSIWSLIRKSKNAFHIEDETWSHDWSSEIVARVPFWATRKRG